MISVWPAPKACSPTRNVPSIQAIYLKKIDARYPILYRLYMDSKKRFPQKFLKMPNK